ncbi:MAG TPA: hypothetical protein VFJ03_06400 [Candidatus Limnocylindria bacterium]|nr:hypothetical protein [Candidatus Limnocylindria bacterium]
MSEPRPPGSQELPPDGPTELVEGTDGEMVERLSNGTATLLLVWLIGTGAASALLAAWLFAALVLGQRMGPGELFSSLGLYVAVFGASGPTLLWLTGRAQGHSLAWFGLTAAKIGLAMIGSIVVVIGLGALLLGGVIGPGFVPVAAILVGVTLILSMLWALVTWSADRYIAQARVEGTSR